MSLFNYVKSQLPILDIVSEYTTLRQAGIYWKGLCPFHNEKTPSFTVSPHRDIFYCFGCHESGDVIAFIAKAENCTQIEAAKILVDTYKLSVPKEIDQEFNKIQSSKDEKDRYFVLCQEIAKWCYTNLLKNKEALDYITKRNFKQNTIHDFLIGYFPGGHRSLNDLLRSLQPRGFLAHDLIHAGILKETKTVLYSPFEERIIFPIKDHLGRFCGFGGRVFKVTDERPKYYNSQENKFFNKGSLLFGLDQAKKNIQNTSSVFLVEGYTDCIAMVQNGFTNTVASLGTACTMEHLKTLSRFTQQVYVLYDGDNAGQNAIMRLTELCWNVNLELKVVCLSEKEDPASFLDKGGNLKTLVDNAESIYSFIINRNSKNFSAKSLQEKLQIMRRLLDIISHIEDPLKKDILLQEISSTLSISFESIKSECDKLSASKFKNLHSNNITKNIDLDNKQTDIPNLEKKLLAAIINNFDLLNERNYYVIDYFTSPACEILKKVVHLKEMNNNISFDIFLESLDNNQKIFINKILLEYEIDLGKYFEELLIQFQKIHWKKIVSTIKIQLANAQQQADLHEVKKIINNFQQLKQKILTGGLE